MPVPDTSDNGIGGCFVSFRGRPLPPEFLCLDPGGLLGDFWVDVLGPGLAGGLTDDVLDDDDLLGGLDCDFENDGDENPCFAETELNHMIHDARKLIFGVSDQVRHKSTCAATESH